MEGYTNLDKKNAQEPVSAGERDEWWLLRHRGSIWAWRGPPQHQPHHHPSLADATAPANSAASAMAAGTGRTIRGLAVAAPCRIMLPFKYKQKGKRVKGNLTNTAGLLLLCYHSMHRDCSWAYVVGTMYRVGAVRNQWNRAIVIYKLFNIKNAS
jgi:hypothetical protein